MPWSLRVSTELTSLYLAAMEFEALFWQSFFTKSTEQPAFDHQTDQPAPHRQFNQSSSLPAFAFDTDYD
jgi:hypothetical protein